MKNQKDKKSYEFAKEEKEASGSIFAAADRDDWNLKNAPLTGSFNESTQRFYRERKRDYDWLGSYDQKDDFLFGKTPAFLPDFSNEEEEE
jgi:hypothetical protein